MIILGSHCQLHVNLNGLIENNYDAIASVYDDAMGIDFVKLFFPKLSKLISTYFDDRRFRFLDLGCGTGNLVNLVSKNFNAECFGVDLSEGQICVARNKVSDSLKDVKYSCANVLDAEFPRADVITMTLDALNHITTPEGWQTLFRKVHAALYDDGIFLFDVNTPKRIEEDWKYPEIILKDTMTYVQCPLGSEFRARLVHARILMAIYDKRGKNILELLALIKQLAMPMEDITEMLRAAGFVRIQRLFEKDNLDSKHIFMKNRFFLKAEKRLITVGLSD